ncbi:MAG TPA: hypothetical protein VED40_07725 [Azospirillaceae bacterium]|nr:hypothetical protein [Azospirillaceae bacterium]
MRYALLAGSALAFISLSANAATISAGQGHAVSLGEQTAVIYFTQAQGDFTVVATLGAEGRPANRLVHTLADGETARLQAAGPAGATPATLQLTRVGDRLKVETPAGKSAHLD